MSCYPDLDKRLIVLCRKFSEVSNSELKSWCMQFNEIGDQIVSLEDAQLKKLVDSIYSTYDLVWYSCCMDIKETKEGYAEIRKEIGNCIDKIEKILKYSESAPRLLNKV